MTSPQVSTPLTEMWTVRPNLRLTSAQAASNSVNRGLHCDSAYSGTYAMCITGRTIDTHFRWYPRSFMSASETSPDTRDASASATGYRYYHNDGKLSMNLPRVVRSAARASRPGRRRARCHGHLYD